MGQMTQVQCQSTEGSSGPKDQASIPPGPPHHVTILQHIISTKYTDNNESKHSEMGPVRQNPIQRTVRSVHMCALHCAQLLYTILHRTDLINFPLTSRRSPMLQWCLFEGDEQNSESAQLAILDDHPITPESDYSLYQGELFYKFHENPSSRFEISCWQAHRRIGDM